MGLVVQAMNVQGKKVKAPGTQPWYQGQERNQTKKKWAARWRKSRRQWQLKAKGKGSFKKEREIS